MDKREAIRLFIRKNSATFNSDPFPKEFFKRLKHDFFLQFAKVRVPKDSEIAEEVIEIMITNGQIKTKDNLDKLLQLPFFKDNLRNLEYQYQKLAIKTAQRDAFVDVASVRAEDYQKRLEEKVGFVFFY